MKHSGRSNGKLLLLVAVLMWERWADDDASAVRLAVQCSAVRDFAVNKAEAHSNGKPKMATLHGTGQGQYDGLSWSLSARTPGAWVTHTSTPPELLYTLARVMLHLSWPPNDGQLSCR
jgi:hypothetical protein